MVKLTLMSELILQKIWAKMTPDRSVTPEAIAEGFISDFTKNRIF